MGDSRKVAEAIADAFANLPLTLIDLTANGISEIAISYKENSIRVSWYSRGKAYEGIERSIRINGKGLPIYGGDAVLIYKAAQRRAKGATSEVLSDLL